MFSSSNLLNMHMVCIDRSRPLSMTSSICIFEQLLCGLWPAQPGHVLSLLLQTQQKAEGDYDASLHWFNKYSLCMHASIACYVFLWFRCLVLHARFVKMWCFLNLCSSNSTVLCSCKEDNCVLYLRWPKETSQCCVFDRLLCCKFSSPAFLAWRFDTQIYL